MAKKKDADRLDGVQLTCIGCVATASTPALDVSGARQYVAGRWGWTVTPSGHDLCSLCVKRGEMNAPEHRTKKGKRQ
jgi:hypothetical protein